MKLLIILLCVVVHTSATYNQDRIRLEDVKVLSLYSDRVTNGRRSSPVPQLKCIGGSAQNAYTPLTVQCYNRGSDGYDTQWECKTDMDNDFRFGKVEVTCEGFDYPDDPYILRGSCGLEYTLEYTKEGYHRQHDGHQGYHHEQKSHHGYHDQTGYHQGYGHKSNYFGTVVMLGIVAVVIYTIYTKCLSTTQPTAGEAPPPYSEHDNHRQQPNAPPPPGFKQDFMPGTQSAGHQGAYAGTHSTAGPSTGGGFWTGAATGGLLGYMFGGRNNNHHSTGWGSGYASPTSSWGGGGSSWGGGGGSWGSSSRSSSSSSSSSGTRTASGFGGTKRR